MAALLIDIMNSDLHKNTLLNASCASGSLTEFSSQLVFI